MKYIDTSALVNYCSSTETEKGAGKIRDLINKARAGEEVLVSSVLLVGETISVFDKWRRLKIINQEEFQDLFIRFLADIKELSETRRLIIEPVSYLFVLSSIDFIIKYHLPVSDAVHLYTMLTCTPMVEELICSDKNLIDAAQKEGLKVTNPKI